MSARGNKRLYHVSAILYGFCIRSLPRRFTLLASAVAGAHTYEQRFAHFLNGSKIVSKIKIFL